MCVGPMDASAHVDPDLWRRYLAMVLDGIRSGAALFQWLGPG